MRYAIFGDTGAQYRLLKASLLELGLDEATYKLPEELTIIHVGDLIHKGSTAATVALVDRVMEANPGQWIQLLGNHELQYFPGAPKFWKEYVPIETQDTLRRWVATGAMTRAFGLPAGVSIEGLTLSARPYAVPHKPLLFTHAGLTKNFWANYLSPWAGSIDTVVEELNTLPLETFARAGAMLYGGDGNSWNAGPAWAHCTTELWASWQGEDEPLLQMHGHTNPYDFAARSPHWWHASRVMAKDSKVNPELCLVTTRVADSLHIAIDPGYSGKNPIPVGAKQPFITVRSA